LNWIKSLKIAVINEQIDEIIRLYDEMPEFKDVEEMKQASALIEIALTILQSEKSKINDILKKLEKIKKYGVGTVGHPSISSIQ